MQLLHVRNILTCVSESARSPESFVTCTASCAEQASARVARKMANAVVFIVPTNHIS